MKFLIITITMLALVTGVAGGQNTHCPLMKRWQPYRPAVHWHDPESCQRLPRKHALSKQVSGTAFPGTLATLNLVSASLGFFLNAFFHRPRCWTRES